MFSQGMGSLAGGDSLSGSKTLQSGRWLTSQALQFPSGCLLTLIYNTKISFIVVHHHIMIII